MFLSHKIVKDFGNFIHSMHILYPGQIFFFLMWTTSCHHLFILPLSLYLCLHLQSWRSVGWRICSVLVLHYFIFSSLKKWGVVVSVRVISVGQIELFNHLLQIIIISYLKPYNCWTDRVSSMGQIELFNHLLRIFIICNLKPYNCWTDRVSSMGQIELFYHLQRIIIIIISFFETVWIVCIW